MQIDWFNRKKFARLLSQVEIGPATNCEKSNFHGFIKIQLSSFRL